MSYDRMNRYWLPNVEINKKVITQELQFYLGPEAHVRPYTRDGEEGYLITTPGACLTDEQIDDICRKSKDLWEKQAAARSKKDAEKAEKGEKPLKRPLHQPVLVSRGISFRCDDGRRGALSNERRRDDGDRRRSDEYKWDGSRWEESRWEESRWEESRRDERRR